MPRSPASHPAARAAGLLTLHLHGAPRVVAADGSETPLERRAAALCALVALRPGTAREQAATWLWPDSQDPRRNLRQQLLRFRKLFGADLLAGEAQLALGPQVQLAHGPGELLAGHAEADDDFGAWLAAQRAARATQHRARWQGELAEAEAEGDLDRALHVAEVAAAADPADEAAAHALMRVHYLRGEGPAGLAVHARLVKLLALHAGREPSAATAALADTLRRGTQSAPLMPPAGAAPAARVPVALKRPPVLAGRTSERAAAAHAWAEHRAVLLEGEAGLGKTRLIDELAATATVGVLRGAGRPGDAGAPYATLARWLAPLLAEGTTALAVPQRLALARLGPAAGSGDGGGPAVARPDGHVAALPRGALEAAVAALIEHHHVALAVLDDLHFADAATLELVAALVAAPEPARRWLFAGRPAELPAAALALRDGLSELQRLEVVRLAPLDEAAAVDLVDSLGVAGLAGDTLAAALVRHTGGNPLYMLETLKLGLHDGSLARGVLPRPGQVGALIARRLARLSEPAITLARVAAIAGVDFSVELAEVVTGQRAVQLAGAWQELQDAHVLRDEAFAHDLVAEAALHSVPPAVARRVHEQCAIWLAERDVEPARVALHWRLGGRAQQAGQAFVRAAERAEQTARLAEEAQLYGEAAQCFAEAGCAAESFDARLRRVRALKGVDFGVSALREAERLVDDSIGDRQRMQALSELSSLLTERGESAAALEAGQAAQEAARRLNDLEWQVRTACHLTAVYIRLGRGQDAVAVMAPLKSWVEQQPDPALRMLWFGDWGAALGDQGRLSEAVAAYDTAVAAARKDRNPTGEGQLLMNCAVALRRSGRFDRALAMAREGRALCAADADTPYAAAIARLVVARDEAESGMFGAALAPLEDVLAEFERGRAEFWAFAVRTVLARLWLDLGQYARAVPLLRDDADALPGWLRADRRLLRLDLAQATGQPPPAAMLDEALAFAAQDDVRGPLLRVRALRHQPAATILHSLSALELALRAQERFGGLMGLHLHHARAALALGRLEAASAAARALVALFDEGYAPDSIYRAEAWWVAHQALRAAGHAQAAQDALRRGEQWMRQVALPQVPAPFIDSFLNRQPVNRAVLAAAGGVDGTVAPR